ncbi:MAG: hypothetical protein NTU43_02755 [Bacteroidetes bacterium]|nr:hypothetical protein [Bacteroidota bacterium]
MKNLKSIIFLLALISTGLVSCKKDYISEVEASKKPMDVSKVVNFKDIKVSSSFDWKSTKEITINLQPLSTPVKINNTLLVKTEKGEVLYSKLQTMNEAFTGKILVPSNLTHLVVSFGSISKIETITNNQVNFNYIVETAPAE